MAKINQNFPFDIFRFIHKPIRTADKDRDNFLERYLYGPQIIWEGMRDKIEDISKIVNPETCPTDLLQYLKDIVGLTRDLRNITDALSEDDLRKVILLAVPLWKTKGIEVGLKNIIKLFTGFNARIFNWFDYRMIIGEKAIGEEQLGEDAWIISRPGVAGTTPLGEVQLLLQFNTFDEIEDGSLFQNPIVPYGTYVFQSGGPFATSDYYLFGNPFYLHIPHRSIFDFSGHWTIEGYVITNTTQMIPLFHKYDSTLNKGVKLELNTTTSEVTWTIADGTTTQTQTWSAGVPLANGLFHHVAWVVDWDEDTDGETSVWVDGNRIGNVDLSGAFVRQGINNSEDIFVGEDALGGTGIYAGIDGIRVTKDVRYAVTLATITSPGVNFVEYQEEQLDEFQIDVRVVDDGTLDRTILKRILNLMRPVSERINILYIDFYDEFEDGKGQYNTISGSAYVEKTDDVYYFKLPELSLEHADVLGASDWKNYLVQHRCTIYSGDEFEIRYLIQDVDNYYAFRVNSNTKKAHMERVVGGVRTALASSVDIDIETANLPIYIPYYVFMVTCFRNETTGVTTLKAYIDSNKIFDVDDTNFEKGTFGLYTYAGTTVWCSEAEMFQMPLDHDRIDPNSEF